MSFLAGVIRTIFGEPKRSLSIRVDHDSSVREAEQRARVVARDLGGYVTRDRGHRRTWLNRFSHGSDVENWEEILQQAIVVSGTEPEDWETDCTSPHDAGSAAGCDGCDPSPGHET